VLAERAGELEQVPTISTAKVVFRHDHSRTPCATRRAGAH
jgi:hypothetical protein